MQINPQNDFVTYDMTQGEFEAGSQFHHLQKAVLQNNRVSIMQELINLKPDDMSESGKETYWQREAYLRGQLDILTHVLAQSTKYEEQANETN